MNLSVYSIRDLQLFSGLLQQVENHRISPAEARQRIEYHCSQYHQRRARQVALAVRPELPEPRPCPHCGELMFPAIVPEGEHSRIWGCESCRYSEYEEVG